VNIEDLYQKYRGHIFYLCKKYVHEDQDAEDIVQNVFIKIIRKNESFENRSACFTWMYRIAVNECLNYIKANRNKFMQFDVNLTPVQNEHAFLPLERTWLWQRLFKAISNEEQMIIILHAIEGVSLTEIADILSISRQALHKSWEKTKKRLNKEFKSEL
jgi:RNA polymerase sigma factor (sigma-70 family)